MRSHLREESDSRLMLGWNTVDMTLAATLENVRFEWASDRSVRLKIRDSTFTFST